MRRHTSIASTYVAKSALFAVMTALTIPSLCAKTVRFEFELPAGVQVNQDAMTLSRSIWAYVLDEHDTKHSCESVDHGPHISCEATVNEYSDSAVLILGGLDYKEYRRVFPTVNEENKYVLGKLDLSPRVHDLAIVDARHTGDAGFKFSFINRTTDPILIKSARFLLYPGSAVLSICMPVFHTVYSFPFHAAFEDQDVDLKDGQLFSELENKNNFYEDLPSNHYKQLFVTSSTVEPHIISHPLELSELVPPKGAASVAIELTVDNEYNKEMARSGVNVACQWSEVYDAHVVFKYNEEILISKRIQLNYVTVPPSD